MDNSIDEILSCLDGITYAWCILTKSRYNVIGDIMKSWLSFGVLDVFKVTVCDLTLMHHEPVGEYY